MESMYCAEQIGIPPELGAVLKQYTKAVIREKPQSLYQFSANFFAVLAGQEPYFDLDTAVVASAASEPNSHLQQPQQRKVHAAPAAAPPAGEAANVAAAGLDSTQASGNGEGPASVDDIVNDIVRRYDTAGDGVISHDAAVALLEEVDAALEQHPEGPPEHIDVDELADALDIDNDGNVDLVELRQLLFNALS